jgi:multidrug resistance efflux pump
MLKEGMAGFPAHRKGTKAMVHGFLSTRRAVALAVVLVGAAATVAAAQLARNDNPPSRESTRVAHCLVSLIQDVQVPAQEAGVLTSLTVREGQHVTTDELMGQIDDATAQMQRDAATIQLRAAMERAEDDIEVRFSAAAHDVAEAEFQEKKVVNDKVPNAVSKMELRRLELTRQRALLQIDKSRMEQRVARMTAQVHEAEVKAAEVNIARREIRAPADGMVVSVFKHAGEWVGPGDAVLRVVRMDRLRIEGFISAAEYNPGEIGDRPVTVEIDLARGRTVQLPGKVVFVSPLVQAGNKYRVRAEAENRQEGGHWLLRPGMDATMTIHVM